MDSQTSENFLVVKVRFLAVKIRDTSRKCNTVDSIFEELGDSILREGTSYVVWAPWLSHDYWWSATFQPHCASMFFYHALLLSYISLIILSNEANTKKINFPAVLCDLRSIKFAFIMLICPKYTGKCFLFARCMRSTSGK